MARPIGRLAPRATPIQIIQRLVVDEPGGKIRVIKVLAKGTSEKRINIERSILVIIQNKSSLLTYK